MRLVLVNGIFDLIYIDSIDENEILFYTDIDRTNLHQQLIDNKLLND